MALDIQALIKDNFLLFDGGMGTMLQKAGLPTGALPELYNITHPEIVTGIHRAYVEAGSQVITANTFQANPHKLEGCGYTVEEIVEAGIQCAKAASAPYVALDCGPTGQLLEPMGTLSFDEAYGMYACQMACAEKCGADLIIIETVSDLYEMKAAILAAKENTSLPVVATMTFQEDGRTFVGCDPATAAVTLSGLGLEALGVNCSLGPKELLPVVDKLLEYSRIPVMVQANAGLPEIHNGETVYGIGPAEFAGTCAHMARGGVRLLGGCCGTTPDYIAAIKEAVTGISPAPSAYKPITALTSGLSTVVLDGKVTVIGERINPTGKKKLKEAIRACDMGYIVDEALSQVDAGSNVLDVNVGLPDIDEPAMLARAVKAVQEMTPVPLQIDSADPDAIEAAVRAYNGKPLINSVNGKAEVMERIFPIAKKYGALVLGLTLDEEGIPPTAEGRLAVAERILAGAIAHGIPKEDLLIDCLVLTASAQQDQVRETLRAIRLVKEKLGLKTVLGVSNVSFGLPAREKLNAAFLLAALGAGLDAPILNPLSARYMEAVGCFRVLNAEDRDAAAFIAANSGQESAPVSPSQQAAERSLTDIILQGRSAEAAPKVKELLQETPPLEIIDRYFIPALDQVGAKFEKGTLFLPQLMQSAEAVAKGFGVIKDHMAASGQTREARGHIVLATVQGDIHDIGKNIVKMLLENYGYQVLDLGKDVPIGTVVSAIRDNGIRLAGLSALMTTTVHSMRDTIAAVRAAGLDCRFFVGGAVLNEEYAELVGADWYARDAMDSVEIANRFFSK